MKLIYTAVFEPHDTDEGYTVTVPDLLGCVSEGDDLSQALDMITDAACGWILGELEEGKSIPEPSNFFDIKLDAEDSFKSIISLDIDAYAEKYGRKAVRKNITIPAWLNTYGEKNHINFSKVLQDALLKEARR